MKSWWMLLIAPLGVTLAAAQAPDVTGVWQGTLKPGNDQSLRIVMKVAKVDAGLKATMYSIDQGGQPMGAATTTLQGTTYKFTVPGIDGSYTGQVSPDNTMMTGTWTQGGAPMPLVFKHVTAETAWAIPEAPARLPPMPADADPTFEVATIKPSKPDQPGKAFMVRGRKFTTINTTANDLITFAYGIHAKQILNGPAWMESEKFDIEAQPDIAGTPSPTQLRSMVKKLLTERFGYKFHEDKKELSAYALTMGKGGTKIAKSESQADGLPSLYFRQLGQLTCRNASMVDFSKLLQTAVLDRPVVDQTGLAGKFDFTLNWTPDESQFGGMGIKVPPPSDKADAPPNLYTAVQEQMGMKLEATKTTVPVFVVDAVTKPTDN